MKAIPGQPDHSTALLPHTRLLVVPRTIHGPTRPRRTEWPTIPDPQPITHSRIKPGRIATIRTRRGLKRLQVRLIARSLEPGRNRGRHYLVGHSRHGICHSHWLDQIIHIEPPRALSPAPVKPTETSNR